MFKATFDKVWNFATWFMTEHRGWFVIIFVLPISLLFDLFFYFRAFVIMKLYSAPQLHETRVKEIQQQIKDLAAKGDKRPLCTARGGWQSISPGYRSYKSKSAQIKINLFDILSLDEKEMTVRVEPMVNMGQLTHFLIPKGYTLPVLPEMDDLTVGGLVMGVGIESSSHKHGLFNDKNNLLECEIITGDGAVIRCSERENKDLFDAIPWSYGTLGFLASATLRIIPCKEYVHIKYIPVTTKGTATFREICEANDPPDFVEALGYSATDMVVMPAWFTTREERPHLPVNVQSRWYKPWFYKYVQSFLALPTRSDNDAVYEELIPLRDYYHRHTKAIFWELEQIIPVGNHWLFRLLLGWAVPPKVSFLKLTQTKALQEMYEKQHVIQDMLVPTSKMAESLEVFDKLYDVYPLWICPYKSFDYSDEKAPHRSFLRKPEEVVKDKNYEMYVDLGAYGIPRAVLDKKPFDAVETALKVETFIREIKGFQMLYADSYLTEEEFRQMFDHSHYDTMRRKFDKGGRFPSVYQKVCKKAARFWENSGSDAKKNK